jgi:hypothetical protein
MNDGDGTVIGLAAIVGAMSAFWFLVGCAAGHLGWVSWFLKAVF